MRGKKLVDPLCGPPRILFNFLQHVFKCYKCINIVGHAFAWLTSDLHPPQPLQQYRVKKYSHDHGF